MDKPSQAEIENSYELNRWLENKKRTSLPAVLNSWSWFKAFTEKELGRTFGHAEFAKYLIDEIEEDRKKSARQRGEPERRLIRFHKWLREEQNKAKNTAKNQVAYMMGFCRANGFRITFTERFSELFPSGGKPENRKRLLKPEDVKKLVDNAKTLRDKAMILTQFEGGMDDKTLCFMNVGAVLDVIVSDVEFITIHLYRSKEEWDYFTHLGSNAVRALRTYLKERQTKNHDLGNGSPLFVKAWTKTGNPKRIRPRNVQEVIRDVAVRCELVNPALLKKGQRASVVPYALRSSFATLLENDNCPQQFKEFWQGHKIKYMGAYFTPTEEISLATYIEHYKALSIEKVTSTVSELESRVREQDIMLRTLMARQRKMEEFLGKWLKDRMTEGEWLEAMGVEKEVPSLQTYPDTKENRRKAKIEAQRINEIVARVKRK